MLEKCWKNIKDFRIFKMTANLDFCYVGPPYLGSLWDMDFKNIFRILTEMRMSEKLKMLYCSNFDKSFENANF